MANPFDQFDVAAPTPTVAANPFDQFDEAPAQKVAAPATSEADRAMSALRPFFDKGVSTRNSAGQWTGEARALLTKEGLNPDSIDQKAERSLLASYDGKRMPTADSSAYAHNLSAVDSVPVVGPLVTGGMNKAAAFTRSVVRGIPYSTALQQIEAETNNTMKAHPIASGIGSVVGGIAGTAPLVAAAPAAFGAGTAGLGLRSGASLLSGAALGGADSAVRSDGDIEGALKGAGVGAVVGGLAPGAGALVGKGVNSALGALAERRVAVPGASRPAAAKLADDLRTSGGADAVQARLAELGPDAMLLDASPSFVGRAQGLAVQPETRSAITAPLEVRNAGTDARVRAGLNEALGEAPVPSQIEAQFAAQRAKTGPLYEKALNDAPAVDASAALAEIAARLETASGAERAGLLQARSILTQEGPNGGLIARSDPRYLHKAKGSIDDLINYGDPTIGVPAGALGGDDRALSAVRRALNGALEEQAPGYAEANLAWRTAQRASEALENAPRALAKGDAAIHPADYAADIAARPMEQQAAQRAGVRADLDRAVGTKANDLQALKQEILQPSDWARQNLDATFGPEAMSAVERTVDANQAFRNNYADIVKNSQTAQRNAAAAEMSVRDVMPKGGASGVAIAGGAGGPTGAALALAGKGAKVGANAVGRAADLTRNKETAAILTMGAGAERDALIQALAARLEAASRGQAVASQMDKFVQRVLQSQNDRSDRAAIVPR